MFEQLLRERLTGICELSAEQVRKLREHFELLQRWNKAVSLTSITDSAEVVERHYCESIFLATHLPLGPLTVVDIGSGAGFPGLPVAILRPESHVTLVESHKRKAVFLREATRKLPNVDVFAERADQLCGAYDWAVSRAVKYSDVEDVLVRLAENAALLTGEVDLPGLRGLDWQASIRLPWGEKRYLILGRVRRDVSRETIGRL